MKWLAAIGLTLIAAHAEAQQRPAEITIVCRNLIRLFPEARFGGRLIEATGSMDIHLNPSQGTGSFAGFVLNGRQPSPLTVSERWYTIRWSGRAPLTNGDVLTSEAVEINRFTGQVNHLVTTEHGQTYVLTRGGTCAPQRQLF